MRKIVSSTLYNISLFVEFGYYTFPADIIVTEVSARKQIGTFSIISSTKGRVQYLPSDTFRK